MRNGWLFFGALGGPILWALRFMVVYPLVPVACQQGTLMLPVIVTVLTLVGVVASGLVSLWFLRRPTPEGTSRALTGRARFMAKSGLVMAALFTLVILAESVPMLIGDPCLDVDLSPRRTRWTSVLSVMGTGQAQAHRLAEVPPPDAAWAMWNPDPLMTVALVAATSLFVSGLRRRRMPGARGMAYALAMVALVAALISPLDTVSGLLFSVHMVQHLVLMLVAAPLLALARPGLTVAMGLPPRWRRALGAAWLHVSGVRGIVRAVQRPLPALVLHVVAVWAWHVPRFYDAALEHEALHVLEHASFFGTAWLFWSALARCARGAHGGPPVGLAVLFVSMLSMGLLSALLAVAPDAWYPPHAAGTEGWSITPLEDQQLAGLLMWVPGSLVYLAAAMLLGRAMLKDRKGTPPLRIPPMPQRENA